MAQVETEKSVFLRLFKYGLSDLPEIFTTYQAKVCDDLTQTFRQLLNGPASHGPFQPKLIMPLATVFVEIFLKEKKLERF